MTRNEELRIQSKLSNTQLTIDINTSKLRYIICSSNLKFLISVIAYFRSSFVVHFTSLFDLIFMFFTFSIFCDIQ